VAIIDLRRDEGPYSLADGNVLIIEAGVDRLDVVEGEYQVGIYVQGGGARGDFYDLARLEILPAKVNGSIVPYNAVHRGFIELTHRIVDVSIH